MHYAKIALAVSPVLITSVSAYGNAIINNQCTETVYYWEDKGDYGPPLQTIPAGGSTGKMPLFQTGKAAGAGPSYKLTTSQGGNPPTSYVGIPITQFEYTVNAPGFVGRVSYDISNVNANTASNPGMPPFQEGGVKIYSPQDGSRTRKCPAAAGPTPAQCNEAYNQPTDDRQSMIDTDMNNDIVMVLCYDNPSNVKGAGSSLGGVLSSAGDAVSSAIQQVSSAVSSPQETQPVPQVNEKLQVQHSAAPQAPPSSSPAPAPSPAPSPAPAPVQEQPTPVQEKHTVYKTVFADPVIETVHKIITDNTANQKREEHIHAHAHAHQKINKRRHGA